MLEWGDSFPKDQRFILGQRLGGQALNVLVEAIKNYGTTEDWSESSRQAEMASVMRSSSSAKVRAWV